MAEVIRMPKMSDTMTEGVIASWLKKVGDKVSSGDILAEVETDKATMELESYNDGTLLYIGVEEKEAAPVDGVIAIIGEKGEDYKSLLEEEKKSTPAKEEQKEVAVADSAPAEKIDTSGINASVVRMPKMSDTMTEGVIASWLKKVGDQVSSGDILAEVETDKATMELESYEDGTLLYIGPKAGESIAVEGVIAIIGEKGADYETLLKAEQSKPVASASASEPAPVKEPEVKKALAVESVAQATVAAPVVSTSESNGRVKASPLAKKLARDLGYDIAQIKGSGDHGRIVKRDV